MVSQQHEEDLELSLNIALKPFHVLVADETGVCILNCQTFQKTASSNALTRLF